jgi:hypothetical protein
MYKTALALLMLLLPSMAWGSKGVVILDFSGEGIEGTLLELLTDDVREGVIDVARSGSIAEELSVTSREKTEGMLALMGASNTCTDSACAVALARNIGADYVVSGTVVRIGDTYILGLRMHEAESSRMLASTDIRASSPRALMGVSRKGGQRLLSIWSGLPVSEPRKEGLVKEGEEGLDGVMVRFTSDPSEASVMVDGSLFCDSTPCARLLRKGPHEVLFVKQRYEDRPRSFTAIPGTEISGEPKPLFGLLNVATSPPGVQLDLDGEDIGSSPVAKREIPPGWHILSSSGECFEPVSYRFQSVPNQTKGIELPELDPRTATVRISAFVGSRKAKGDILLDGRTAGRTGSRIEASICSKKLEVVTDGGKTWSQRLALEEGQDLSIEARMIATGHIAVEGEVDRIELERDGELFSPGELPEGAYSVKVFFPGMKPTVIGSIEVKPDKTSTISCDKSFMNCRF